MGVQLQKKKGNIIKLNINRSFLDNEFSYSFTMSKHRISISQKNDVFYELKIDGKSFEQLIIDSKLKK
jgi:hypothetical protein